MSFQIRHSEPSDLVGIQEIYSQRHAIAGTLQQPYPSLAMWQKRSERWGDDVRSLVCVSDNRIVGHLGLMLATNVRRRHCASFGMGVHENYLKQGVGRSLLLAAIDLCDNWLAIRRIEIEVFTDNEPAVKLYQSLGFEIEGTQKAFAFRDGQYEDVYAMARIISE